MKLYRTYSLNPLVQIRLDAASEKTNKDQPYLWFHCGKDREGKPIIRMKAIRGTPEEAAAFIKEHLYFFVEVSGQGYARTFIHRVFKRYGMDVRKNKGRKGIRA